MLTPLDIKQQRFKSRLFGGYDKEEVQTYLNSLAERWKQLTEEKKTLEKEVERLRDRLAQYEQMESLLQKTLMQAEASSQQTIETAKREAKAIIQNAETEAKGIIQEALKLKREIEFNVAQLVSFQEEIIEGLQSFLQFELEKIKRFQVKKPPHFPEPSLTRSSSSQGDPKVTESQYGISPNKALNKGKGEAIAPNEPPLPPKANEENELIEEIIKELE